MSGREKILFVCLGNVVRSPLAENLFRQRARERGLADRYRADSAGTSSYHIGESPDRRMRETAAEHGLEYDGASRQVQPADLERFDLVIAMDHSNANALRSLSGDPQHQSKIRLLREFDPAADGHLEVPDPYYGGKEGFRRTYDIIDRSIVSLLDSLEQGRL